MEQLHYDTIEECTLCGCTTHTREVKILYGYRVCNSCRLSFATRRRIAYVIDGSLAFLIFILVINILGRFQGNELLFLFPLLFIGIFPLVKDGFGGYSPGKALMDLRVINDSTGKPIGFWGSLKRNFTWSNWTQIRICFELAEGYRTGDERAHSKVIWTTHSDHPVFLPVCKGGLYDAKNKYERNEEEKKALKALKEAVKTETKGNWNEAIILYHQIMSDYPDTQIAKDADIALKALQERIIAVT